jgi:hypothetical protein
LAKIRVDINISGETKALVDAAIDQERQDDIQNDRPPRSKSMILEAILRQALHYRGKQQTQVEAAR